MSNEKTRAIGFRCPTNLYEKLLKDEKPTRVLIEALNFYDKKELLEKTQDCYRAFNNLFMVLSEILKAKKKISINEFIDLIQGYLSDNILNNINKINEVMKI